MLTTTARLEAWGVGEHPFDARQASEIHGTGVVRVSPAARTGWCTLRADSRIGVLTGRDWEVRIEPHLAIPNVMFLLGYASDDRGWKDVQVAATGHEEFFVAVAAAFSVLALRAITPAPLRGYRSVEETSVRFVGRLRVADQIARRGGVPTPLEIVRDDHTPDIHENRLLRACADVLLRLQGLPTPVRKRLRRIHSILQEVAPALPSARAVPRETRMNHRYTTSLGLASRILEGLSVGTPHGPEVSVSFVFDLNRVFEDFVGVAFTEALMERGGRVVLQDRLRYLDVQRAVQLIPDLVWYEGERAVAVLDAKYKPLNTATFPNADAFQMFAYASAYGLDAGTLIYARDRLAERLPLHSMPHGIGVNVKALDVEQEPNELLAQVRKLAADISVPPRPRRGTALGSAGIASARPASPSPSRSLPAPPPRRVSRGAVEADTSGGFKPGREGRPRRAPMTC